MDAGISFKQIEVSFSDSDL